MEGIRLHLVGVCSGPPVTHPSPPLRVGGEIVFGGGRLGPRLIHGFSLRVSHGLHGQVGCTELDA